MKKQLVVGIGALLLGVSLLSAGSVVFAEGDNAKTLWSQMLPHMKQVHPNLTDEQLQQLAKNCGSFTGSGNGAGMMSGYQGGNQ